MKERKLLQAKIDEIPLFELVGVSVDRDGEWVEQEKDYAVVEEGESDSLNYVSERYNLVQIQYVFRNAVKSIEGDITGNCYYHEGRGELEFYPRERDIGLMVRNSVDGSYALQVDFATKVNGNSVVIPSDAVQKMVNLESYKRIHTYQNAEVEVGNYLEMLSEVQDAWNTIVKELGNERLEDEEMKELAEDLELGTKFVKKVENHIESDNFEPMSFWDFMLFSFKEIHEDRYKSDIHYREKVRSVADTIISECVISTL